MNERLVHDWIIPPAMAALPSRMDTDDARAMLLAIGLQESKFQHRTQIGGPARGFWQFEQGGGVRGVMGHAASQAHGRHATTMLCYPFETAVIFDAIADNDVLACVFARLLLWTHPKPLPSLDDGGRGAWQYYLDVWRPGRPHPQTWDACYARAASVVRGGK